MTQIGVFDQVGLSGVIFIPWMGALLQALLPSPQESRSRKDEQFARWVGFTASLISTLFAWLLIFHFEPSPDVQAAIRLKWISAFAIFYDVGLDGVSLGAVALVATLFPLLILTEWRRAEGRRGFHALLLLLQGALIGALTAQDLFLQFLFWSMTALPVFFWVGFWGGEFREKASTRLAIHAFLGNALLFASVLFLYFSVEPHSFSIGALKGALGSSAPVSSFGFEWSLETLAFCLMTIGFLMRMPAWPFVGAFSALTQEAPFSVSVAVIGGVVPAGLLLWLRNSYILFPGLAVQWSVAWTIFGTINFILGVLLLFAQKDLRGILLCLAQGVLGLFWIGSGSLTASGLMGAILGIIFGGAALAGLGLVFGALRNRATDSRFLLDDGERGFGGVAHKAPILAAASGAFFAALLNTPGTAGFVSVSMLALGSFQANPWLVVVLGLTYLVLAYGLLSAFRALFLGKAGGRLQSLEEIQLREKLTLVPILGAIMWLGIYPQPIIEIIRPTVQTLLSMVVS